MKKFISVLSLILFIQSGFCQQKMVIAPENTYPYIGMGNGTTTYGEAGYISGGEDERSKIYIEVDAWCGKMVTEGDMAATYKDETDFKTKIEARYNNGNETKSKCCFKIEPFGGGTLAIWEEKVLTFDKAIDEEAKYTKHNLYWQGKTPACFIVLQVSMEGDIAKAKNYISEMIDKVKKTDFTKLK